MHCDNDAGLVCHSAESYSSHAAESLLEVGHMGDSHVVAAQHFGAFPARVLLDFPDLGRLTQITLNKQFRYS